MIELLPFIASVGAGLFALIYRWMRLRFFWRIYCKGGAKDVETVAKAMKWEFHPGRRQLDDEDRDHGDGRD